MTSGTSERPAAAAPTGSTAGERMTSRERLRLVLVLGFLTASGPLTVDLYLPALPAITGELMTTAASVQLTLTGMLAGLALGQLLVGPVADAVGRRTPLLAGMALHVVASVLCVIAPNIAVLGVLRVLQGLGCAAATVVAMAIVRDLFVGHAAARLLSRLMLVMGAAPILAPTVGGLVLGVTSWRGIFALLAVYGVAILLVTARLLPETLPVTARRGGSVRGTVRDYRRLLTDRVYVGLILVAGLSLSANFAYIAGSSFVFQEQYGLTEQQFGLVFGAGAIGLVGATQVNVRLLRRFAPAQILTGAVAGGAVAGLLVLLCAATGFGGMPALVVALWLVLAAAGLAVPNAPALALSRHGEAAGTAAALLGAVQFGVGAIAAPLVGVLGAGTVAMGLVITGALLAANAVLLLVVRPGRLTASTPPAATDAH
ncbi:multidrug effflux MFS transporter [Pseudonocardia kunmingensis]|uniref:DHA1 family bicyclomycin/chloramphenicol resistance-like MFS transporter n=1 Tax=Pseudonocardia kunmingensis TaxID=630975 RepID=A0A543CXA1_9PSEU|nr:multidrug effflux MFS transporter [Pseudonocardia kunmingensis]TQM01737.1 DHA1 family bicyclomycin/chloramphenicol resistance-like MFS transporter [Pseudonocardia kunmingensis]